MKRIISAVNLSVFQPAAANEWQDVTDGSRCADTANDLADPDGRGVDGRLYQVATSLATATPRKIDASLDWRDRLLWGEVYLSTSDIRVGGANDYLLNDLADPHPGANGFMRFAGYTGAGANSNVATGAAVSAGNPPVNNTGASPSWAARVYDTATNTNVLWLYADPTDGALWLYNNNGSTLYLALHVHATGQTGKRS